ncbi:Rv3235 family protein [Nesterenkonia aerolata]|uniref:Rv3235 family protein n=1 Tax=Nesterenkonia aerolata TaxID=3074079 RepID=A0ABU2DP14_9MICC|nr:Rv3235 family protein [Nesterenkonia sp. LY-0111]MDR8018105.1 Rv3235 family protein [Nesterenkonia sp. LY-0111]
MTAMTLEAADGGSTAPAHPSHRHESCAEPRAESRAESSDITTDLATLTPLIRWDARVTVEERSAWGGLPPRSPSIFGLRREDEVPALLRRSCPASELPPEEPAQAQTPGAGASTADPGSGADGRRPTALASQREEQRQIMAISRIVCQATLEALAGQRPAGQLQRWLEPSVWAKVAERAELLRHLHTTPPHHPASLPQTSPQPAVPRPAPPAQAVRRLRTAHIAPGSWEVSVVLDDGARTRACALRLQAHRGRWQVCAMELG